MANSPSSEHIGALWPVFPDVPVAPVNIFTLAYNDSAEEFELTLGRIDLPVGVAPEAALAESAVPTALPVRVVARLLMTRPVLAELGRLAVNAGVDAPE